MFLTKCTVQRCHGEHALDRVLEALVLVRDRKTDTLKPAGPQRAQELDPEGLGLDLADVQSDHLAHAGLVHRICDHQCLGAHVGTRAHLDVLGIQPQIRIAAFQRALPEDGDLLIERAAQRRDPVLGHAGDPQLLDQAVDLARGDPVDICLEHDGHDRLL